MCLLGTAPLLKTFPPSLPVLSMDFCTVLPSYHNNCQQPTFFCDIIARNVMGLHNKTINYLELVVHIVFSEMSAITAFPSDISSTSGCPCPTTPWCLRQLGIFFEDRESGPYSAQSIYSASLSPNCHNALLSTLCSKHIFLLC